MIAKIRAAGATEVIQHGTSWKEADTYLREEILDPLNNSPDVEGIYCPPFDDPRIWDGNSTMIDEIAKQLPGHRAPDAVVCSVGGGGLFNGVIQGLDKAGWSDVPVLAMETAGADSLNQSLKKGSHITLPGITSLATSLGAVRVSDRTYELAQRPNVKSVVLRDGEAAMGLSRLADDEKLLVELACGVSTAVCYDSRLKKLLPGLKEDSKVVIVLCGGSNVTVEMVAEWRETFKEFAGTKDKVVPSSHTVPLN
jgi:L-serine/L-threonine ammonia-lyase